MTYNGNSDSQDLVSLLNDLTGMDNNVYTLQAKTRDMNTANRTIWAWIHDAYGGWLYDDSNNTTDFPTATASLVSGQRDYGLPSELLTVRGVEVKNQSGIWEKLVPATEEQIRDVMAEKEFMVTASQPIYYTPYSNSIRVYPAANYAQSASLRISYDRGSTSFISTDTTKTPGFISEFHDAVAYGAAVNFSIYKTIPQADRLERKWQDFEKRIKQFYTSRFQQLFPPRMTVRDAVKEYQ